MLNGIGGLSMLFPFFFFMFSFWLYLNLCLLKTKFYSCVPTDLSTSWKNRNCKKEKKNSTVCDANAMFEWKKIHVEIQFLLPAVCMVFFIYTFFSPTVTFHFDPSTLCKYIWNMDMRGEWRGEQEPATKMEKKKKKKYYLNIFNLFPLDG